MSSERQGRDSATPLSGVTVLDASRVLSGPFCTMQLADLGADVIKIERPDVGDQTRGWAPPTYGDSGESAYYLSINRNKRSMTLDLGTERGRDVFRDLASEADVLVENFRVGTMDEWGLGYTDLRPANPDLVYCSISGYGQNGPDRHRPAYDLVMQAEGGMMSITGEADGPPIRVGIAIADIGAGMYATQAILGALFQREFADAGGDRIDISLFDTMVAWQTYMASNYFATDEAPERMGSKHPTIAPYQAFPTRDDYAVVACASEHIWPRFCRALDREDLIRDERFRTNEDRVEHRDALDEILGEEFRAHSTAEIVERLREYDVPASSVNDLAEVFDHRQVEARDMRQSVDHPTAGTVEMPGSPMTFARSGTRLTAHPPRLGEHTAEILEELGFSDAEIDTLRADEVV
jgi:crotonobetainyl-CoA:carnitine CoA-transferase CaiB-like acyl-CoA transferase